LRIFSTAVLTLNFDLDLSKVTSDIVSHVFEDFQYGGFDLEL